jgi:hypothetical protein
MKFAATVLLLLAATLRPGDVASYSTTARTSFVPGRNRVLLGASTFVSRRTTTPPVPKQQHRRRSRSSSSSSSSQLKGALAMFSETSGGMEELQELAERADAGSSRYGAMLSRRVRRSPSLFKLASAASVPLSAALGFGMVPSRRFAAHTVGAVITGIAGAVGKSRLDALAEESAKPALAEALVAAGGLGGDADRAAAAVSGVRERFGLPDEDFESLCTEIYAAYLLGMVKYVPTARTGELKELENLKRALRLDNLRVGEAHAAAAEEWYRTACLFTPEEELDDPTHPDRQATDKLLFLTERALRGGGETEEAFRFEMTRVARAVKLDLAAALDRVADTAEPFYRRALKSTRAKLGTGAVSSDMLRRARNTLGISDATAFDMHVAAYNEEVRELLGLPERKDSSEEESEAEEEEEELDLSTVKFAEGAQERVSDKFNQARFRNLQVWTNPLTLSSSS